MHADDILLYRKIHTEQDYATLQQDVDSLGVRSLLKVLQGGVVRDGAMDT